MTESSCCILWISSVLYFGKVKIALQSTVMLLCSFEVCMASSNIIIETFAGISVPRLCNLDSASAAWLVFPVLYLISKLYIAS